jgi:hypothetical protein
MSTNQSINQSINQLWCHSIRISLTPQYPRGGTFIHAGGHGFSTNSLALSHLMVSHIEMLIDRLNNTSIAKSPYCGIREIQICIPSPAETTQDNQYYVLVMNWIVNTGVCSSIPIQLHEVRCIK